MKYIIIPTIKIIIAIGLTLIYLFVGIIVWMLYFIWTFDIKGPFEESILKLDTNNSMAKMLGIEHKSSQVYKTPFHWAFNGRYDDFK